MILVIGGSGFIGSHLVQEALRRGESVRVFDQDPYPATEVSQPQEVAHGDLSDTTLLEQCMRGCHTVYHLAGIAHLWRRKTADFDRVNRQGTENVLRAAQRAGGPRVIYTGTESILVSRRQTRAVTEEAQPTLQDMIGPYCRSKFLAEQAVFQAARSGLPATVVSPTMPIGPGDRNLTPPGQMIASFLQGRIPAYLACRLNLVDVRDVAVGHLQAAIHGRVGQRLLLAGYNLSLREILHALSQASGKPAPKVRIPYHVALVWSLLEHLAAQIRGKPPTSSITGVRLCRRSLVFDGSRTWRQLRHAPRDFQTTIADAVTWHLGNLDG